MDNYFEFMNADVKMGAGDNKIDVVRSIEFKNVYFKYPGRDNYALNDINFKIESPMKVALVG